MTRFISPLLVAFLVSGPVHGSNIKETRVLIKSKCPIADFSTTESGIIGGLAAILIPGLVDKGLDLAAAALKKAGEDKVTPPQIATAEGFFYDFDGADIKQSTENVCLVVVRGEFAAEGRDLPKAADDALRVFARTNMLAELPEFVLEVRIQMSDAGEHFRLEPATMIFSAPIEPSIFTSNTRSIGLLFTFSTIGSKDPFASTSLSFTNIAPGSSLNHLVLTSSKSDWMQIRPKDGNIAKTVQAATEYAQLKKLAGPINSPPTRPKDGEDERLLKERRTLCGLAKREKSVKEDRDQTDKVDNSVEPGCPVDLVDQRTTVARLQAVAAAKDEQFAANEKLKKIKEPVAIENLGPYQVKVALTETEKGSELLKYLGSVLESSKADLATEIKTRVVPSQRAAAELVAQEKQDQQQGAALAAKIAVQKKELEILAEQDEAKKKVAELDLAKLKFDANVAYRKAGLPVPYPEIAL